MGGGAGEGYHKLIERIVQRCIPPDSIFNFLKETDIDTVPAVRSCELAASGQKVGQ